MDGLTRFYPHMVQATMVLLQGLGAGVVAADVLAWALYSPPRLEAPRQVVMAPAISGPAEKKADLRGILARNMFCATCEPISLDDLATSGDPGEAEHRAPALEGAELVSTMVSSRNKDSLATIVLTNHAEARFVLVSEGDSLGDALVTSIEEKRVVFLQNEVEKVLYLMGEIKPVSAPVVATTGPPPMAAGTRDNRINQVGPNKWEVDKTVITDFMKNMASAGHGAQIVPNVGGGFRVTFVRAHSDFFKLGVRTGDVIQSVNNIQLDSIDQAFAMYTKLKDANHLTLTVNRGGQTINMDYSIR